MKYLDFYYQCMATGVLPKNGLCICFGYDELFTIIAPTPEDRQLLRKEGLSTLYWASGVNAWDSSRNGSITELTHKFTELRQTIVLLLAAMNGEL